MRIIFGMGNERGWIEKKEERSRMAYWKKKQQHHIMLCVRKEMGPLAVYSVLESRVGKNNFPISSLGFMFFINSCLCSIR